MQKADCGDRGFLGDIESWKYEYADLLVDDLLAVVFRNSLPRLFGRLGGFPDEGPAFDEPVDWVDVGEGFRIAAEDNIDVAQVAVDPHTFGGRGHEILGGGPFLFRSVFGICGHVNHLFRVAELVDDIVPLGHVGSQLADDLGQVLAGGDHAPATDGVEANGDRVLGKQ